MIKNCYQCILNHHGSLYLSLLCPTLCKPPATKLYTLVILQCFIILNVPPKYLPFLFISPFGNLIKNKIVKIFTRDFSFQGIISMWLKISFSTHWWKDFTKEKKKICVHTKIHTFVCIIKVLGGNFCCIYISGLQQIWSHCKGTVLFSNTRKISLKNLLKQSPSKTTNMLIDPNSSCESPKNFLRSDLQRCFWRERVKALEEDLIRARHFSTWYPPPPPIVRFNWSLFSHCCKWSPRPKFRARFLPRFLIVWFCVKFCQQSLDPGPEKFVSNFELAVFLKILLPLSLLSNELDSVPPNIVWNKSIHFTLWSKMEDLFFWKICTKPFVIPSAIFLRTN